MARPDGPAFLLVWDFDHTIVDANTDTWYCSNLAPELEPLFARRGKPPFESWTHLMDDHMRELHARGYSSSRIRQCFHSIPMAPATAEAILAADAAGAEQCIVSDSNTLFIRESLLGKGLSDVFPSSRVFTNPACVDAATDRIHIAWFQPPDTPHGCGTCAANLCKAAVLRQLRDRHGVTVPVVYVGDGRNDFCPTASLGPGDTVLAREGEAFALGALWRARLAAPLDLAAASESAAAPPRVRFWTTGDELLGHVRALLAGHL